MHLIIIAKFVFGYACILLLGMVLLDLIVNLYLGMSCNVDIFCYGSKVTCTFISKILEKK
jgi:hypothetical protein